MPSLPREQNEGGEVFRSMMGLAQALLYCIVALHHSIKYTTFGPVTVRTFEAEPVTRFDIIFDRQAILSVGTVLGAHRASCFAVADPTNSFQEHVIISQWQFNLTGGYLVERPARQPSNEISMFPLLISIVERSRNIVLNSDRDSHDRVPNNYR